MIGRKVRVPGEHRKGTVCEARFTGHGRERVIEYVVVKLPGGGLRRLTRAGLESANR